MKMSVQMCIRDRFLAPKETSDIISDGIAFGAIQVPSHGKPIILLAEDVYKRQIWSRWQSEL